MTELLNDVIWKSSHQALVSQFPIPTENKKFKKKIYRSFLEGTSVIVDDSIEAKDLYFKGFYGTLEDTTNDEQQVVDFYSFQDFDLNNLSLKTRDKSDVNEKINADKRDTVPEKARLVLTLEEGFFLSYSLGCLLITENERHLSIQQQWNRFCHISPTFVTYYVTYHHLRSKGLVPRCGSNYGVPFVAYYKGMPFSHSSFMISIICEKQENVEELDCRQLASLLRIATSVKKQLILIYITSPQNISSVDCLRKFSVKEVLASRWITSKDEVTSDDDVSVTSVDNLQNLVKNDKTDL